MPNHVTNVITVNCSDETIKSQIILSMMNDEGYVDFNQIIPKPKILEGTTSPNLVNSEACLKATGYTDWYGWCRDMWGTKWNAYGQKTQYSAIESKRWHETVRSTFLASGKERCYRRRINKKRFKRSVAEKGVPDAVRFETAWCIPEPVMFKLSCKFPDVQFDIQFADEDTGSNCGTFSLKSGEVVTQNIAPDWDKQSPEERRKWTKFAFNLSHPGCDPKYWGYNKDWEYEDE